MNTQRWTITVTPDARARTDQVVIADELGLLVARYPSVHEALIKLCFLKQSERQREHDDSHKCYDARCDERPRIVPVRYLEREHDITQNVAMEFPF